MSTCGTANPSDRPKNASLQPWGVNWEGSTAFLSRPGWSNLETYRYLFMAELLSVTEKLFVPVPIFLERVLSVLKWVFGIVYQLTGCCEIVELYLNGQVPFFYNRGSNQSYQNRVAVATGRCLCGRDFSRVPTRDPSMSAGNQCWMINTFWNPLYYSNEKRIFSLYFIAVQLARYLFVFALYIFEILGLFYIFEIWSIKNALLLELGKNWCLILAFGACNRWSNS